MINSSSGTGRRDEWVIVPMDSYKSSEKERVTHIGNEYIGANANGDDLEDVCCCNRLVSCLGGCVEKLLYAVDNIVEYWTRHFESYIDTPSMSKKNT